MLQNRITDYTRQSFDLFKKQKYPELLIIRKKFHNFRKANDILLSDRIVLALASIYFYALDFVCLRLMMRTHSESYVFLMMF
jgi:hypothetical protein